MCVFQFVITLNLCLEHRGGAFQYVSYMYGPNACVIEWIGLKVMDHIRISNIALSNGQIVGNGVVFVGLLMDNVGSFYLSG